MDRRFEAALDAGGEIIKYFLVSKSRHTQGEGVDGFYEKVKVKDFYA